MNRRNLLKAALLAPLLPTLAKLEPLARTLPRAPTNFAALTPAQKRVWSRAAYAQRHD